MGEALFKQKNEELLQFEATANAELKKNQTELAYRNLNSNFFNLEKDQLKNTELEKGTRGEKKDNRNGLASERRFGVQGFNQRSKRESEKPDLLQKFLVKTAGNLYKIQ